jgi:hypothetical protein
MNTEIKVFNRNQNLMFILTSLALIWSWMWITYVIDRGNDRGLITIIGTTFILSLIFSIFLAKNKITSLFITTILLSASILLIVVLTLSFGFYIGALTDFTWLGLLVPILTSEVLTYLNIRRLISFPNNKIAFWCIISVPPLITIGICCLPFYTGVFRHEFGIGFIISVYLTFVIFLIAMLCEKNYWQQRI